MPPMELKSSGIHKSVRSGEIGKSKRCGITPTTLSFCPLSEIDEPTIRGSPPNRRRRTGRTAQRPQREPHILQELLAQTPRLERRLERLELRRVAFALRPPPLRHGSPDVLRRAIAGDWRPHVLLSSRIDERPARLGFAADRGHRAAKDSSVLGGDHEGIESLIGFSTTSHTTSL